MSIVILEKRMSTFVKSSYFLIDNRVAVVSKIGFILVIEHAHRFVTAKYHCFFCLDIGHANRVVQ